jgi:cysteine desulfurase/selenocysteine lyase
MTIPTPTSDALKGDPRAALPAGLPDATELARLAGEFFATLPGGSLPGMTTPAVQSPLPAIPSNLHPEAGASLAHPPQAATAQGLALRAPHLIPSATAPNGVPDHVLEAVPGLGRPGGVVLGVPEAHGAHSVTGVPKGTPSFPATPAVPGAAGMSPGALQGFSPAHASATPAFYFLDFGGHPQTPAIEAPGGVPQLPPSTRPPFDVQAIRRDFPILQERVNGRQLVWFDNAATTQKPQAVIDRLAHFYAHENSNIHRAAHELAARATDAYEDARETVRRFIGAGSVEEIVFVRGTTEAINLIAGSWGRQNIGEGDEIIVSHLEHHANIVPWQMLAAEKGARIRVIPVDDSGQVLLDEFQKLLCDRTKLVSVTQVSNALGTVVPVKDIVDIAHRHGVRTLVDGAQSVSHMRVDVRQMDTDFFVFSGHKVFGPTGIGVVYGKREVLEEMPPWQGGGNMISDVTFEKTTYHGPPTRFEAGTGNIADAVGLGAALEYVERIGIENIGAYEHALLDYATHHMRPIPGLTLIGTAPDKASVLSFLLDGYSTDEVGKALNQEGIAVRTGHHCAQPILRRFGLETTVRPSLAFYNTCEEIDRMVAVVRRLAGAAR